MISLETEKLIRKGLDEGIPMAKIAKVAGVNGDTVAKLEALPGLRSREESSHNHGRIKRISRILNVDRRTIRKIKAAGLIRQRRSFDF